ncbi:SIMPL domain-containing protein [uncultured Roseobacter sp.]|uniref:SIMPL domain-containing protein n=1 Tax=uncultured Roseobacter sp. TaxID=114847 RepID=UPI002613394F|nr:SIMPL domain-containing protein [uncultured Roseobacter sp.]
MRTAALILSLWLMAVSAVAADTDRTITTSGTGTVEQAPDMAVINIGVTLEALQAADALDGTSDAVRGVLAGLDALGIAQRDVATSNISLQPVWNNRGPGEDDQPRTIGFTASNTLSVRVRNLSILGDVMELAVADGANRFNGVRFAFQDPDPIHDAARAAAVRDAIRRARLLADAAGVGLGDVISISERGAGRPSPMMEMSAARVADVPVAAGELSVSVIVDMVFGIADP